MTAQFLSNVHRVRDIRYGSFATILCKLHVWRLVDSCFETMVRVCLSIAF
jgi:hypothetical protein